MLKLSPPSKSKPWKPRWFGRGARSLGGLALGLVVGCGSEEPVDTTPDDATQAAAARYAQAVCGAVSSCKCMSPFASQEACVATLEERFLAGVRDRRMEVVQDCLNTTLDRFAEDPCGALRWRVEEGPLCSALRGEREDGMSCSLHFELPLIAANECAGELSECEFGRCESAESDRHPPLTQPGDACIVQDSRSCVVSEQYCDLDGRCQRSGVEGEACGALGCVTGLYCQDGIGRDPGICRPREPLDAPCNPLDHIPCAPDPVTRDLRQCHPVEGRCTPDRIQICTMITHPHVDPNRS